jgi:hypothetical protein
VAAAAQRLLDRRGTRQDAAIRGARTTRLPWRGHIFEPGV